jgi:hypothetical protein
MHGIDRRELGFFPAQDRLKLGKVAFESEASRDFPSSAT